MPRALVLLLLAALPLSAQQPRDPALVERILAHLALPTSSPPVATARLPPQPALPFA